MNIQAMLKRRISAAGGLRELAREMEIDHGYLCRVASGKREPGDQILNAFGLERIVSYRKKSSNGK